METYDAVVVGGGPAGATAATDLANAGHSVLLLDRAGRVKPCGGAVPPRMIKDFDIPDEILVARVKAARMISPSDKEVDMPIEGGFVGMVDRAEFDEWLRDRAAKAGAKRRSGQFETLSRDADGTAVVAFREAGAEAQSEPVRVRARMIVGADGARSKVARQSLPHSKPVPCVFAYHEIVRAPGAKEANFSPTRCDVYYQGKLSPDFYAWVFPHGHTISVGTGSAQKGFALRKAVRDLRESSGLDVTETVRSEGAPIPLKPLKRWDNGKDVVLAGDAAGAVAPSSGEGIYYAMLGGRLAADAVHETLETGNVAALKSARRRFMKANGRIFWILGMMQWFWYSSDSRRERFVSICKDPDVQRLTWQAYMHKKLVKASPLTNARIFVKDMAHLLRIVSP